MTSTVHRLAYLVSHPIQYQAPLLRHLAAQPDIDLTVFFLSDLSRGRHRDVGFDADIEWDVPLLDGYRHVFLDAWRQTPRMNFVEPLVRGLGTHLTKGAFDALWVHGWNQQANIRAMRIARAAGMRVLLRGESTVHGDGWKRRAKDVLQRHILSLADAYLAIGSRNREFYAYHGVDEHRIFDMPYAVDNAFFRGRAQAASETREELRAELGLEPGRPIVLSVSKLIRRKRPFDLLHAYEMLSPDGPAGAREPEPYLLFVGDGPERRKLEAFAATTGWSSIRCLGFKNQTELPRYYDLCDVFVLPSEYEPWGLVLNEAMNAGCPIVATECVGAARDLVLDGENGYTVPVGDRTVLADRLRAVLDDPARRLEMGRASLERVREWSFERDHASLVSALDSPPEALRPRIAA